MKKHIRRDDAEAREGGFTLVEMVIAISVLSVMILAASGVLNGGVRALAAAKARARANDIATEGIEDLQRFSFNTLGLCDTPTGTPPAGLETTVVLSNCAAATFENPCDPTTSMGVVPRAEYTCERTNVTYTVKRYVAWVDALQTTKRLAVFVEWTDLVGRHQVSQQSSLRAPDQSAITGLAPPTFSGQPTALPGTASFGADLRLTSSSTLTLRATTSTLHAPAAGTLSSSIAAHQPTNRFDVTVTNSGVFPAYNGFPVTISQNGVTETFTLLAGAGTANWVIVATGSSSFGPGATVRFGGDQVHAVIQTLGPNNSPQQSVVFLEPETVNPNGTVTVWTRQLGTSTPEPFRFGEGFQFVRYGIVRAADGKTSGAFAHQPVRFCPELGCTTSAQPLLSNPVVASPVALGSSGDLQSDLTISVTTTNVTSSDAVTAAFLTQAGTITVALQVKSGTTCPDSATAVENVTCSWQGTISKAEGYRIAKGQQTFYFTAQQILDTVNPGSIDRGSTAVATTPVNFQ